MNAKRKQSAELELPAAKRKTSDGRAKRLTIMGAIIAALVVGTCYMVWQEVGPHVLASGQYQVEPDQIRVAPAPPPWVRSDIKSDVIHQARLDGPLSIVDRDLTVRIAAAFAAHPWVARVERVSKQFPSGLDVLLSYRKPAALVEVQEGAGGLPVDAHGVLLPTKDFSAQDADEYPRIGEIHSKPLGSMGTAWGDPCVVGAAQIAAELAPDWKTLGLFRIVPAERKPARTGVEYTYALVTRSGTKIHWGRSPATTMPGEIPAAKKIAQLKRYASQNGSLDDPDGQPHEIVISPTGALLSNPRPNIESLPKHSEETRLQRRVE
jgi:hypothetical protein